MNSSRSNKASRKRYFRMTGRQVVVLGVIALMNCFVLGLAFMLLIEQPAQTVVIPSLTPRAPTRTPTLLPTKQPTPTLDGECEAVLEWYTLNQTPLDSIPPLLHRLADTMEDGPSAPGITVKLREIATEFWDVATTLRRGSIPVALRRPANAWIDALEQYGDSLWETANAIDALDVSAFERAGGKATNVLADMESNFATLESSFNKCRR